MTVRDEPLIRVTAMPTDTTPYGEVFDGWLMGQMGLTCGFVVAECVENLDCMTLGAARCS